MEEGIDLREYVDVLVRNWKWIVGLTLIAAVVAGIVSFLLPPVYEARALIVVEPRYLMRFDPKFETVNNVREAYKAYPTLATGDELLQQVITTLGGSLTEEEQALHNFAEMEASSGGDPSLIELKVKSKDAEKAALIASTWAELYVRHLNDLYGQALEERFFEEQLATADANLKAAEEALIEFQARNQASVLNAQLEAKETALSNYLAARNSTEMIIQDALSLKERLRLREGEEAGSLADDLAVLFLELDTLSGKIEPPIEIRWRTPATSGSSLDTLSGKSEPPIEMQSEGRIALIDTGGKSELPIEVQITGGQSISKRTLKELGAVLDDLVTTLRTKKEAIEEAAEALSPEILHLQEELQKVNTEAARLERARDVAQDTYLTLSRKVEEVSISAQSEMEDVRLASRAVVPTNPVSPRKLLNTAVAGALGLMVGVFGAFALEYFQSPREESIRPG